VYDTVYSDRVDGLPARFMKSKGAKRIMKKKLNPLSALFRSKKIAKLLGFPWLKLAVGITLMGPARAMQMARMAIGFEAFRLGTIEGDNERGVLPIGQVSGIIHDTPSVKEVIERIVKEANIALKQAMKKV